MSFCVKCGNDIPEGTSFCPNCGTPVGGAVQQVPVISEYDHTAEFELQDIQENKVFAMLSCLLGCVGSLITYLGAKESKYAMFYAKEALKCTILQILLGFVAGALVWTIIVPIAAGICVVIIEVCQIIGFFTVCQNLAKEIPVVRAFKFLSK